MEDNLNMDIFSNEPVVDIGEDEFNPFLSIEDEQEDEIQTDDTSVDNDNTADEDQTDPESVVGSEDSQDEAENETTQDDVENSSSDPNLFNSITALLVEKGLLSVDSDIKVEDEDSFVELFRNQTEKIQNDRFNDHQKEYLAKLEKGIPQTVIEKHDTELSQYEKITEEALKEDSDLRQRIIYQDNINRGYSDEKARKLLQRSVELEEDIQDSIEAITSIKEAAKLRQQAEQAEIIKQAEEVKKAEEANLTKIKNKIKNSTEVIKDFVITENVKNKVEKNMFDVVSKDPNTNIDENLLMKQRREDPIDFDFKLYYLFTITDGFKNFDALTKSTNSKVVKDLEKAFKSNTRIKDPGSPAYLQDPESYSIGIAGHEIVVD